MKSKTEIEKIGKQIVDATFEVHSELGPGLLESVYEICLVEELKEAEVLLPVHEVQTLTYMKLADMRLGYSINFNVPLIKQGIKRILLSFVS